MANVSVFDIAGRCGVQPPLSLLQDIMAYGEYATTSLRSVLSKMASESVANPDSTKLLSLQGSATIGSPTESLAGYDHTIHLDLTLTNLQNQWVLIDSAQLLLTDSGGYVLMVMNVYGQGAILAGFTSPMLPLAAHHGTMDYNWGGGPFNIVISVHGHTSDGKKQHILRRIPIVRPGFSPPPNISVPAPVFVGLWCRPGEIVKVWRNGVKKWITVAGHIVNLTRDTSPIRIDNWRARIVHQGTQLIDLKPPEQFRRINPDNSVGAAVNPSSDGSVTLSDVRSGFVYGWEVDALPDDLSKVTLQVELRYTQLGSGQNAKGIAICAYQLTNVKPLVLQSPLKSSGSNAWWWGNAPDHTGFDAHAWSGERYCYDIVIHDAGGKTFTGDCHQNPDGTHGGSCATNANFYAYGQPVYASIDGNLVLEQHVAQENSGYNANPATGAGNYVVTKQNDQSMVGYFHLKVANDAPKPPITAGKQVGSLGNSGASSEPHLHLGGVVLHPTGRGVIAPLSFTNLKSLDNKAVTVVPGNGLYKS